MLVIKSDVLRQGSKRNARDIQDIIVADDGYGAPKMDGKGTKIERTWKWAANPKKLIVHWDEIPLEWQACSSQTDYLGIASHEMPMRRSSRSCFIIVFSMARKTLEVKLGTDIGFLRKCSRYSIWFQGFGVLLKGGRLWTTVRYHCGHSLCTDLSRGQGKPTGWHSNSDHNAEFLLEAKILCEAKELRCFFFLNVPHNVFFSMRNYWKLLRLVVHHFVRSLLWIERHWIALSVVTTINFSFSGASYRWLYIRYQEYLFSLQWPSPNVTFGMAQGGQDFKPCHTTSDLAFSPALYRWWFVSLASAMKCNKKRNTKT